MISISIFILSYLLFIFYPVQKGKIAFMGALLLFFTGELPPSAFLKEVHWNVMGLFVGTLLLAELFILSRVPAVIAEELVDLAPTVRAALISLFALSSIISMGVENVAVVLILAPIMLSLCEKLNISPIKPMIFLSVFANMQGTATLIGDPPSMLLGAYLKMDFSGFFFYQGKISIFFFVQLGFISALVLTWYLFRKEKESIKLLQIEKAISWVPSLLLILLVVALIFTSWIDPDSKWFAGTLAMLLGGLGLFWNHFIHTMHSTRKLLKELDWNTALFLLSLFLLVAAIREAGWIDALTNWTVKIIPLDTFKIFVFIILFSIVVSAFVDNVPYLLVMMPFTENFAKIAGAPVPLFMFALLIGACLGGNITPIGASANVAAVSFLYKRGYKVGFGTWCAYGILFTLFATLPAAVFLWYVWS